MERPTMTLHECAEAFRANLIPITESSLSDGIARGDFAWASTLPSNGNRRKLLIWRDDFYAWLSDKIHRPATRA